MLDALSPWLPIRGVRTFLYTGVVILLSVWFLNYYKKQYKRRELIKLLSSVPGPRSNFLFGEGLILLKKSPKELFRFLSVELPKYGDGISTFWAGSKYFLMFSRARTVEPLFSSTTNVDKGEDYALFHPWLGEGLLISSGEKWRTRRKILTPAFHFKILDNFIEVFNTKAQKLASKFQQYIDGEPFGIGRYITNCTLDIILESAMGVAMNVQDDSQAEYFQSILAMSDILEKRIFKFYLRSPFLFKWLGYKKIHDNHIKILHNFSYKVIRERRIEYREKKSNTKDNSQDEDIGKKRRLAFLDLLVERAEEDGIFTDVDIREQVDTFVFAGHDTTAAATNFSIYLLGRHPEIQKKLQTELDSIFGDSDRPATMDDLREMKYLECCIKEALRIYTPVPFIGRCLSTPVKIDKYLFPVGARIMINQYQVHRDPEYFPDPEKFDPDRFAPENTAGRHPFAFVPFSAGARNCIGQKFALMELKVVLSTLFRRFRIKSVLPQKDMEVLGQLVMRPVKNIEIKVYPRSS